MNLQDQLNSLNALNRNNAFDYMGIRGNKYEPINSFGLRNMIIDSCTLPMTMASYDPNDPIVLAREKQKKARKAAQAQEMSEHKEVVK
jgi:hypothetical protein